MSRSRNTSAPAPITSSAATALTNFVTRLRNWLQGNAQGLAHLPDAPATSWEHMAVDHPAGALVFHHAADSFADAPAGAFNVAAMFGFIFPESGPQHVAGEYIERFKSALAVFAEAQRDEDTGYTVRLGVDELKLVLASKERDAFTLRATLYIAPPSEENAPPAAGAPSVENASTQESAEG